MRAIFITSLLLCCIATTTARADRVTVSIGHTDPSFARMQATEDLEAGTVHISDAPSRTHVEMYMFARALKLGGLNASIELHYMPNYARSLVEAMKGSVTTVGQSVWKVDAREELAYISQPLLRDGEMVKVLYTSPRNERALAARTAEQVSALCATTCPRWKRDVEMLEAMNVSCVEHTTEFNAMLRMVASEKVDFIPLSPTSTPDLTYSWQAELVPIPGVKVVVHGSRHLIVSRNTPDAERIFHALEKGLNMMRESGEIHSLYRKAGLLNPAIKDWKALN